MVLLGVCKSTAPPNKFKNAKLTMDDLEQLIKTELAKHREGCHEIDVLAVEIEHDESEQTDDTVFEYTIQCNERGVEEICEVFFVKDMRRFDEGVKNFVVDCKGN